MYNGSELIKTLISGLGLSLLVHSILKWSS